VEKAYAMWRAFQDRFLVHATALVLVCTTLLALLEVFRRYVIGQSFEWQQDAVTFFTLSAIFLYFGISQRHGSHLNVTLLVDSLDAIGPRTRFVAEVMRLVALVISFFFLLGVVWMGWIEVVDSFKYETRTESLAFPMGPFLVALMVGFFFMAISVFFQIYREFHKLRGRSVLEEPVHTEEMLH
jgi:TRAP-type C4-dicarboxylate transport system permease small subunit